MLKYVLCVAVDKEHKNVVLIEKLKPDFQKGKYNCPGGKIDEVDYPRGVSHKTPIKMVEQDAAQCSAHREFLEECGINGEFYTDWEHIITLYSGDENLKTYQRDTWEMFIMFNDKMDITQAKSIEAEQVKVFPIDELPPNIMPNLKWVIPLCLDGKFKEVIEIKER
jgi:8-oxo-dGTP diphosphatase